MARPKITWSEQQYKTLEGLCGIQCTTQEIEDVLHISIETVDRLCREHYSEEGKPLGFSDVYKKYSANGKSSLRRYQFEIAKRNASMAIWLGKQYLGQRDNDEVKAEAHPMLAELSDILKNDK